MKNLTRREFLKGLAILPVLALPRPKGGVIAPEVQQNDKALLTGIERANTKLIDNANFDVEVDEPDVTIFDMLDDFNKTVTTQADAPPNEPLDSLEVLVDPGLYGQFERTFDHALAHRWNDIEPGAAVYLSWDKGNSWDHAFFTSWDLEGDPDEMERYKAVLDSCECALMEWHVEYRQCESPKWEYVKCPDCGSDNWVWNDGFRCLDCGAPVVRSCQVVPRWPIAPRGRCRPMKRAGNTPQYEAFTTTSLSRLEASTS